MTKKISKISTKGNWDWEIWSLSADFLGRLKNDYLKILQ